MPGAGTPHWPVPGTRTAPPSTRRGEDGTRRYPVNRRPGQPRPASLCCPRPGQVRWDGARPIRQQVNPHAALPQRRWRILCRRPIRMSLLCQIDMTLPRVFREVSGVTVRLMSDKELARLEVLRDLDQRRLAPAAAAQLLGLERRQVFRLLKVYRTEGAAGLISKRRGRPSNRRQPAELRATALAIIREGYWDFGPTLAAEKLSELHGIALGRETLRQWMIADGLWVDRKQRLKRVHQPRPRRECVGELVQIDGCEPWWFEDCEPQCTLLVFVDDATGRLMHLQFVES